jgi:hypothetical protein
MLNRYILNNLKKVFVRQEVVANCWKITKLIERSHNSDI